MRKQLLNQQTYARKLKWLFVLFVFMFMPYGAWAEDYNLWVAGVQVTDANASNVLNFVNENDEPAVVFNASTNTLTLNNATIDGNIVVTDVLSALNIKVKGQNVINAGNQSAIKSLTSDVALSFAKEGTGDCSLQLNSDNVTVISTGFSEPTYTDLALVVEDENIDPEYANYADRGLYYYEYPDYYPVTSATITSYTTYDIIVNGETVTSVNKNSILKGSAGVGHISFDGDHTLTLNKVPNYVYDGSYPFIQTSMDLTINLVGINEFDCGQRIFITRMEGDEDTHTVTFTTDENHAGSLILTVGDQFDGFEAVYQNGLAFKPDGYYDPSDENKPALWIAQASLGLKVGGIVVTQGNSSDILGQGYPSASYDATSGTLTLTSCQYSHYTANFIDISSGITSLNIHLLGYNGIGYGSYGEEAHWLGAASACTVNITTDANVPGELEYWSGSLTDSNITLNSTDSGLTLNDNSLVPAGGTDNITYYGTGQFHDGTDGGTDDEDYPYYDYSGGMWYYSNAVRTDGNSNLPPTVMGIETGNGYVSRMRTNGSSGFVNLSFQYAWVNNENTSVSVALTSRDGATTYATGNMAASSSVVTLTPSADITMDDVCLTFISESPFAFLPVAVQMVTPQTYPITIAGKTITSKNASDVLGDGKVNYDTETNTLTLNGATIGGGSDLEPMEACGIEYTGAADLTISLKGTNTITGTGGCEAIRCDAFELETVPKLIFTRGDNNACSLQLSADDNTTVILGFSDVQGAWGLGTVDNGLAVIADNQVRYDSEDGLQIETVVNNISNYVALSSVQFVSYYGLAISGVPVYEGNKDNITGDGISGSGSASFDPTSNTLTLNNIKLNPDYGQNEDVSVSIVTSLAQLDINLIGESQAYAIKAANENCAVTFKSAEEYRGAASLNFWYSVDPYFIGFGENKVTYDDGLCLRNNATSGSFPKIVALYVPQVITDEPEYALYFPDHEFKFELEEEVEGFDIYYCNMLGGDPVKSTDGTFTLTPGDYALRCYPIYPGMNTDASWNYQFASEIYPKVIEKPSFSVAPGTYNDNFTVYIQNVPEQESTYIFELDQSVMMPQVWYYIGDNQEDSVLYDPEVGIPVTETERISVYIIDGDSGKVVKSDTVMAEYTIPEYPIAVTFGDRQWATYVAAQDLSLPTNLEAYIVTEVNTNEVTTEPVDYIPEGVGVLLHRTDETSEFVARAYSGDLGDFTENMLVATEAATSVSDLTADGTLIYVLFNDNFVRATSGNIPAGRCYLPVNVNAESRLAIRFGEDVTGIANVNRETINNNNNYYNLSGQRIAQPTKGLYIVNGKKVIIK